MMTLKVPSHLDDRLAQLARERGTSKSAVVREAIVAYLVQEPEPPQESFAAAASELAGCVAGPRVLSTDPRHLEGYGR